MITLENISALNLQERFYGRYEQNILTQNNIMTYQDLKNYLENESNKEFPLLEEELLHIEKKLIKLNKKAQQLTKYITPGYKDKKLLKTDKKVLGKELILTNPISKHSEKSLHISKYSIYEIKFLLTHLNSKGDNALCQLRSISKNSIDKVVSAISMYEEQVIRQSKETKKRDINLFYLNKEQKRKIVIDSLKDIVYYLIENTYEELVWGKLTEPQRIKLLSSVQNDTPQDRIARENLINIITNYTTLTELEQDITKSKTLTRFIKK